MDVPGANTSTLHTNGSKRATPTYSSAPPFKFRSSPPNNCRIAGIQALSFQWCYIFKTDQGKKLDTPVNTERNTTEVLKVWKQWKKNKQK